MKIFIPTYGRAGTQVTLDTLRKLPETYHPILVVQKREAHLYNWPHLLILPDKIRGISPTRQYIMDWSKKQSITKLCMMDDDLRFFTRRKDEPDKFLNATPADLKKMLNALENALDKYAHAGVLAREGGNRILTPTKTCTRMMRVLAYNVDTFHKEKIRFDRLPLQQDFDATLQLLRKGYQNMVLCGWVQNQGGSNTKGGCSTFRTLDMLNENAAKLAKLHAPFVKTVSKTTKSAWGGAERVDVHVQWKKAYESSKGE